MKLGSRLLLEQDKAKKKFYGITLKMILPIGEAKNNTTIGPLLGQHQINIISFCNEFNSKSVNFYENGVIVPVYVTVKKDKTYTMNIRFPLLNYYLEQLSEIELIKNESNEDEILFLNEIKIEKLYDILLFFCFFLKKDLSEISYLIFGYLSSFNKKFKIIF